MHVHTYSTACEPGAQHIWETSDLLRLICTCTKSPVYPECTAFTGTYPPPRRPSCPRLRNCWVHWAHPTPQVLMCLPAKFGTLPPGEMTKHTLMSLDTNHPSSKRNPTGGMVWCTQIMYWYCLSSSAGQNAHTGPVPAVGK